MKNFIFGAVIMFSILSLTMNSDGIKPSITNFVKTNKEKISKAIKSEINHYKKIQEKNPLVMMGASGRPIYIPKNLLVSEPTKKQEFEEVTPPVINNTKTVTQKKQIKGKNKATYITNNRITKITIITE